MRNRNNYNTARRRENFSAGSYASSASYMRNRNTVRHANRSLGSLSLSVIIGLLVLVVGLIYVSQGTRATAYDYELSDVESQIAELEAERDDLKVERARLTSIAATENSTIAANMEDGKAGGYANE